MDEVSEDSMQNKIKDSSMNNNHESSKQKFN